MTKRDHYICAALAGVVARMNYRTNDPKERVKAVKEAIEFADLAMQEADGTPDGEAEKPSATELR